MFKLLGTEYNSIDFYPYFDQETGVDVYAKAFIHYDDAIACANVGIGVKKEEELVIAGTKGYIYVPSSWWKTIYFEIKFENTNKNEKYFFPF